MPEEVKNTETDCSYLQVLVTHASGKVFGHRVIGAKQGPQLVVTGHGRMASRVFERLLGIPTLPWLRGALVLIRLDSIEDADADLDQFADFGVIDRTLALEDGLVDQVKLRNYRLVLGACTQLGMIDGRGVPGLRDPVVISMAPPSLQ